MKKIIKRILKIFGIILSVPIIAVAVCCIAILIWSAVQMSTGSVTDNLPVTSLEFTPEIRLIAFTDTHRKNENVAAAIDRAYELFDEDEKYKGVDAFFCLGDFTDIGTDNEYKEYADTLKEHLREDSVIINVAGNHEFKADNYNELFNKYFSQTPDTVTEINGFTCIGFSGERFLTEWTVTPESISWLSEEIEKAENTAGDKPVFVFQHPHPFGTVYGSTVWCNPQLNPVFSGHSKVINFSGHSHFPMNDPRSINQTTYTCVGVGAMARFETDKNYIIGQHPEDFDKAAQLCVIEADSHGSVRIRGFDLLSDTFFCDYYIADINDPDSYAYTYKNLKAHDTAPVFPSVAKATASICENGEIRIEFTKAQVSDGFIVHSYEVKIKDENGKKIYDDQFIAPYYIISDKATDGFTLPGDALEKGKTYTLCVTAESAYHKKSEPVTLSFTVPEAS